MECRANDSGKYLLEWLVRVGYDLKKQAKSVSFDFEKEKTFVRSWKPNQEEKNLTLYHRRASSKDLLGVALRTIWLFDSIAIAT